MDRFGSLSPSTARASTDRRRVAGAGVLATAALVAGLVGCGQSATQSSPAQRPNLVWIVIDALRADHLGFHGYSRDTSPFLDRLAAETARFERAHSHESYTLASAATYFTSTYPATHGVLYDHPETDVLPAELETVAEVLFRHGWETAGFVFNPHLSSKLGFDQGFALYDDGSEGWPDGPPHQRFETAARIHRKVETYLERPRSGRPLFLYLHYRDVHGPYVPPPPYHDRYLGDVDLPPGVEPRVDMLYQPEIKKLRRRQLSAVRIASYDAEIRYTDDSLEKLVAMLGDHGLDRRNTVFVITSDHGEEFLDVHAQDRGGISHGRTLYQEQVHVPLLISVPRLGGLSVQQPVGLVDLPPTLYDLLKIDVEPGGALAEQMQGRSLVPLLAGRDLPPRPLYLGGAHGRGAVLHEGWKLYRYPLALHRKRKAVFVRPEETVDGEAPRTRRQLFDLGSDPGETVNRRAERPDVVRRLQAELDRYEAAAAAGRGDRPASRLAPDAETERRLRALGYL